MKNLLTYKIGSVFTGKEIKEWIQFQLDNDTAYKKYAQEMTNYSSLLEDDKKYKLIHGIYQVEDNNYLFTEIE